MKKGYLGIDIGSISTKAVLLDEDDNIISSCYLWTKGSPINAVKNVLKEILKDSKDTVILLSFQFLLTHQSASARHLINLALCRSLSFLTL